MFMNWIGVTIGAISFLVIGIFHPIVIKGEYYFSAKIWPIFLVVGIALCIASLFVSGTILSASLAVTGCSSLWGIGEIKEQEERVARGWFPKNPNRQYKE